jgi:hypothetical protein
MKKWWEEELDKIDYPLMDFQKEKVKEIIRRLLRESDNKRRST